jgi:hypothetical protein
MGKDESHGDEGEKPASKLPPIKKVARDRKREAEEKEKAKYTQSINDEDMERAKKRHKGVKGAHALGDSSLFSEEKIAHAPKKKATSNDQPAKSSYNFRGYDPLKDGKKGKKKSHHKFKSKSKFKRRK